MKRYFLILVLMFLTLGLTAQDDVLTLDSCFALARTNNAQFKTNRIEIEKAQEVKKQVYTKFFPQVDARYFAYYAVNPIIQYGVDDIHDEFGEILKAIIEYLNNDVGLGIPEEINLLQKGHSISATAIQPVYAGGRVRNGNKLAELGIEAAELKAQVSERDVMENIESTYYLIVGLKSKVATLESALNLIDSLDRVADVALKAGLVTKNDQLRVALERNKYKALQMQLNNGIVLASQLLCQEIGIEYPADGLNLDNDLHKANVFYEQENFERPEMRLLQMQIDAEVLQKKLTRGATLPQVGIGAMLQYGNVIKSYKGNAIFFAAVQIPILQWWETSHKIKEHDLKIEQYEIMQKDLTEKMTLQEKQAFNQMSEAMALMKSDESALEMAQENYRVAELNYKAGVNTITDVLEANALLLQAENAITDRQITYVTARRRYHDLTGK